MGWVEAELEKQQQRAAGAPSAAPWCLRAPGPPLSVLAPCLLPPWDEAVLEGLGREGSTRGGRTGPWRPGLAPVNHGAVLTTPRSGALEVGAGGAAAPQALGTCCHVLLRLPGAAA